MWVPFFWTLFVLLCLICFGIQVYLRREEQKKELQPPPDFVKFQRTYLLVYLIVFFADWLQGPYIYALYESYGFPPSDIALLFITGFGSSALFGTFFGSLPDKYGRKKGCILFGVLYSTACLITLSQNFYVLLFGRLVSGIATSLLFSVFEAWMVSEHNNRTFPGELISQTFSISNFGNGLIAIIAGLIASAVATKFGNVAPYMVSLLSLITATALVAFSFNENYGDQDMQFSKIFSGAWGAMVNDYSIPLLGLVQSLFEASMYVFVFGWTPVLTSYVAEISDPSYGLHGLIFSCFMVCVMLGSGLFSLVLNYLKCEVFYKITLLIAALSFFLAASFQNGYTSFFAFVVFETCVGVHFPSIGTLRSRYIPEESRSAVMNFFRIPLNIFVIIILKFIDKFAWSAIYVICGSWLLLAAILLHVLSRRKADVVISVESDWGAKETI